MSQSYLKFSKLLFQSFKVIHNLSQNFVKVVPKLTQISLKLQCFCMTIQTSSCAFVFPCTNNSPSRTWRSSSAVSSPGEPKTWPTPPVLRSPINLSWFACVLKTYFLKSNRIYMFLRIQFKLNTALLSTVSVSVRHRRDISHFSHI